MRIISCESTQEAVNTVVSIILERVRSHPDIVIGLATGRTMEPVYEEWVRLAKEQNLDHADCSFFMLDEYLGIESSHPSSFRSYIQSRLMKPLALKESQFAFPPSHLKEEAGLCYEKLLTQAGGVDLQLLGIGQNGHIGFNEPGSSKDSRTRTVNLTQDTIEANRAHFGEEKMPETALSMGIGTILEGKELLLLATGKSKADAIKYLMNHHDDESCPVTFLKSHSHFTLVLDPDAASKISLNI